MAKTTGSTADFSGGKAALVQSVGDSSLVLEADFLFSAEFVRPGDDLLLRGADGSEILLPGYFAADAPPPLETAEGARLMPETVEALAAPETVQSYAQAGGPLPFGQPIGEVSLLNGTARVQRPDGTRADLHAGDPIFQGDVVSTGVGSELGIVFIDETVFSLSANARMIINELIYNPGSTANSMGVSLIQGTFVFVTGQVAPNGGMDVETPVGTIGIRGTTVGVEIATFNGRTIVANLTNPDTGETGSFIFSNNVGDALFSLANHYLDIRSANADPGVPRVVSGQDITAAFGRALSTAIQLQRSLMRRDGEEQEPGEQEGSLEGDTLHALQEAGLTPEQIEALLGEPIETAAGPQGVQGGVDRPGPLSGGSSFGGGLQSEAESNNGNATETPGGVSNPPSGTLPPVAGDVTPPPSGESNSNGQQSPAQTPPPPPPNAPPVVTVAAPSAMEDELLPITGENLLATDAETSDPAQLVYTVQSMSNGYVVKMVGDTPQVVFTFTQADVDAGLIYFQHDGSEGTEAGFSVTAADPDGGVSPVTAVVIPVTPVNDMPVAIDDEFSADADEIFTGDVLADNAYGADWDEEDALTITAVNGSAGAVGQPISLDYGNGGLLTVNEDGSFSFDPDGDFDHLGADESAEVTFTYTVSDGNGGTDTATVTITVDGANDAPDAANDVAFTNEDTAVIIDVLNGADGFGADSDPDGDPLSITEVNGMALEVGQTVTLLSGALLTLNADGTFSYDPNGQFEYLPPVEATAEDSFTYTVSDGHGGSSTATVTVTITGVNDAPDALDDSLATDANSVLAGDVFTDNGGGADSDLETDPFNVTAVNDSVAVVGQQITLNSGALLTLNADGTFSYDPNGAFGDLAGGENAEDSFSYTITDSNGDSDTATVTITVTGTSFVWTGAIDDNWHNPANWETNAVPVDGADVFIGGGTAIFSEGSLALASLTLDGGALTVAGGTLATDTLDDDDGSTVALTGGSLTVTTDSTLEGAFEWSGGTLDGDGPLHLTGSVTLGDGPVTLDGNLSLESTVTLSVDVLGSGSLVNVGVLTVTGDVSIAPAFTNSGTMTLPSSATLTVTAGNFTNAVGGVVNGGGTISVPNGAVTNNGTINPGSSPGTLTIDGHFVLGDSGVLRIEVNDSEDGQIFDVLSVTGSATLNGGIVEFVFLQEDMIFADGSPIVFLDAAGGVTDDGSTSYRFVGFNENAFIGVENGELELAFENGSYYYGGGPGIYYRGGSRADSEVGSDYGDDLYGGGGSDTLDGGSGSDDLFGGAGDDFLTGGTGSDDLDGGEGSDRIEGGEGADWLEGGEGDDSLMGGEGDDDLEGGAGTDTLAGGEGVDYFVLRAEDAADSLDLADIVTDFEVGVDSLALAGELSPDNLEVVATENGYAAIKLQSGGYLAVLQNISSDVTIEELTAGSA